MEKYIEINNYAYINIGKSNCNEKILNFKTKLEMSNKFYSYPFGSTKMRYQQGEMFNYELILEKKENEYCFYKLKVKRFNKPNCIVTSNFFFSEGWTIDLYVLNIPDKINIDNNFINLNKINSFFPENYGEITINLPKKYVKPKIGIVMPLFSRFNYVEKCLESLSKSNLSICIFLMMDESLTKEINDDKIKTNELIKKFKHNDCIIIKVHKNSHGNMFESILKGFDFLGQFCDNLLTVDSDVIFKHNWIEKIYNNKEINKFKKPIILTGFNSISHKIKEDKGEYFIKESLGGCNMCFNSSIYFNILRYMFISYKWDTLIGNYFSKNGVIICTKPSQIEHIGYESSGHRKNYKRNISLDKSIDF